MASASNERSLLMELPLELRHRIFEALSARGFKEKYILRQWFERKDVEDQIAEYMANDPSAPVPHAKYFSHSKARRTIDDQDNEEEDMEPEDEDEQSDEMDVEEDDDQEEEQENDDEEDEEEGDDEEDDDGNEDSEGEDEDESGDEESDEEEVTNDDRVVVVPHSKWRHVPKIIRLTKCPPPPELLLVNKELNEQVRAWYCKMSALEIDVTASFGHTSFFETCLDEIAGASSSVIKSITMAKITLVWDTAWIRTAGDEFITVVFPTLRHLRITKVLEILKQAPYLEKVTVHWHDTVGAEDLEGQSDMSQCLGEFLQLNVELEFKQDLIGPGKIPREKRLALARRAEFQEVIENGHDLC
ncbi:hypothetical protein DM02DRAFT_60092 [Periconia macrospinosa]|uniref:Uncharacterized protein n=1 Tax=Periconia macrospinosa TaxID=97972 RepID=A0A2V1DJ61_9PLEO|nr:hypothetical protein DM02DRAFT_60092 [Periconia macrospinosa]